MPFKKENHGADVESKRMRCWKCDGTLRPETAIDLHNGVSVEVLSCLNCGSQWHSGQKPRPVIAA